MIVVVVVVVVVLALSFSLKTNLLVRPKMPCFRLLFLFDLKLRIVAVVVSVVSLAVSWSQNVCLSLTNYLVCPSLFASSSLFDLNCLERIFSQRCSLIYFSFLFAFVLKSSLNITIRGVWGVSKKKHFRRFCCRIFVSCLSSLSYFHPFSPGNFAQPTVSTPSVLS